ncbi:unnamed protein product [Parnassius apollo]|uniref:(apollo) hypothetical protein n=1 Tax=Parnassius apollo TaxID=110799 RepID=A0A8S3XJ78_PARAO|nr:unnamed protein product [Parnassius apollo]
MSSKRLRAEDIEDFLGIPSGSEDGDDFSEAESDENIKFSLPSIFFSESLTDIETSPQRYLRLSPTNEDVYLSSEQQINTQTSTSGVTSARTTGDNHVKRGDHRLPLVLLLLTELDNIALHLSSRERKGSLFGKFTTFTVYWKHKLIVTNYRI